MLFSQFLSCLQLAKLRHRYYFPGPWLFKTNDVVGYVSLKFQTLISEKMQYFILKNVRASLRFLNKKYQCTIKHLTS